MIRTVSGTVLALAALAACAAVPERNAHEVFFDRLSALCGRAFEGRVASPPVEADRDFTGRRIVMRVSRCERGEIRIPVQVGEDRSRTWIVTRTRAGLRLAHDHRHGDGIEDRLSRYGGATAAPGTPARQSFPADAFSQALFARENIPVSMANVWSMEVHPGRTFAYELRRPGRFFRLEFDVARPLSPPASGH